MALEFIAQDKGKIEIKAGNVLLKKKNPLFSNESIEGETTFPFTIPMTDELKRWLNHPERPEAVNISPIKKIQLIRNGIPVLAGDLRIGDANDRQVETTLITGSSPFAALIKDMHLDEIALGFQQFADEAELLAYWNATVNGNVFSHPYYLPSIVSPDTGNINLWFSGYQLTHNSDKTYMSPMLYYSWMLPKLFEALGYELDDKVFINNAELREMLFFSMHNVNSQADPLTIHFADLLPHYKISTWLIDIQNAFGVKFFFDANKQKVTLDWQVSAISNIAKAKVFPHEQVKVKAMDKRPSKFSYTLNDGQTIWPTAENMLPAVWQRKDMPNPNDFPWKYIYVAEEDQSYWFTYDESKGKYVASPLEDLEEYFGMSTPAWSGNPPRNWLANFSIGDTSDQSLGFSSNIHPLHVLYPGGVLKNFTYLEADAKSIMPYVLFAKHTTDAGMDWVYGDYFLNDFSFTWPKSTWLLQNKLLPWWQFLRDAKQIEDVILMSDVDLANWDWTIPVKIGNVSVLVDEMEIPLSAESEKMEVKITGYVM